MRPTNVMGASKRLAELVVQAHASGTTSTCFSMVRRAMCWVPQVRGSSVSTPNAAGGPITFTHPEIIRYFMTIPEAATLVLQSAVLSQGGDVLLLIWANRCASKL